MASIINSSDNQARFLAAFSHCNSLIRAARWARISRTAHYNWLNEDPTYPGRFSDAKKRAVNCMYDEAVRRAAEGVRKPVWYKGKICGYETEYSDMLLARILEAEMATFRRDSGGVNVNIGIDTSAPPSELVESRIIQLIDRRRESGGLPHDASGNTGGAPVRLELVGAPVAIDARNEGRGDQS